ncbi:hypothetical protein [Streptomyces nojiriensis]|uniref:hypothetical protein n=1 Tax=Streptomyces nojiriensis TaxID=66374 RepID=UPI001679D12D|nr:hypothetical protein [Streptomyces nojiriensis]
MYGLAVRRWRDVSEGVQGGRHLLPPPLGEARVLVEDGARETIGLGAKAYSSAR